jgi:hypothetical protein
MDCSTGLTSLIRSKSLLWRLRSPARRYIPARRARGGRKHPSRCEQYLLITLRAAVEERRDAVRRRGLDALTAQLTGLLILFAMGIPGWLVFNRLKLPGAPILGSMLVVGIFQVYGIGPATLPDWFKPVLQIVVGMFIGLRVRPDTRQQLRGMVPVALLVSAWWLSTALAAGYLLYAVTDLDIKTALLGSTPGGISEMGLMALSFGADAAIVALLQFFRVTIILVGVPLLGPKLYPLLHRLAGKGARAETSPALVAQSIAAAMPAAAAELELSGNGETTSLASSLPGEGGNRTEDKWSDILNARSVMLLVRTLAIATAGALLLEGIGFPAGGLVGAMLAVGAARMFGVECVSLPSDVRSVAQVGLGGLIGLSFTAAMLQSFGSMVVPILLLTTVLLFNGFVLSIFVHRLTGWAPATCVLSTCAGGLTNIGAVAEDLGGDPVQVTLLHVVRLISIVTVLPALFGIIFGT